MNSIKKNIKRVLVVYLLLFILVIGNLVKFVLDDSRNIIGNPYNSRMRISDENMKRGNILDAQHNILAETYETEGQFERRYPYGKAFAHLVGYSTHTKSGIEARNNFELQRLHWETVQRFQNIFFDKPLEGNNIVLTVDAGLQQKIYENLGQQKGAVVVMEPSTGKILAMVSYPSFDPNSMTTQWEALRSNEDESPLLNRATQGLYPPGSIFKIVTAMAAYEQIPDYNGFHYDCQGALYWDTQRLRCYNATIHGMQDIFKAFPVSCNTFFAALGLAIGGEALHNMANHFYFNQSYPLPFEYARSQFPLDESADEWEIIQTAIGQGKTLTTPMHMAMLTSAIANGGIMMKPYVVDAVESSDGKLKEKFLPEALKRVMTLEASEFLKTMMVSTVASGTGLRAEIAHIEVAGKTGTAQNASDADHGWFVAFAPAGQPQVAVSVLLENSDGPSQAMDIAKMAMEYVLEI